MKLTADTESTLNDLDSQASNVRDRNFWSDIIKDMEVPEFIEPTDPTHLLPSDATPLQYFLLMFPLTLIQVIVDNTNLYARQSGAQGWIDTTIDIDGDCSITKIHYVLVIIQIYR